MFFMRRKLIFFSFIIILLIVVFELIIIGFFLPKNRFEKEKKDINKKKLVRQKEINQSNTVFSSKPSSFLKKEYRLGDVIVRDKDLEERFSLYYPNTPEALGDMRNWQHIASILTDEAIILNEAVKKGVISQKQIFFNPKEVNLARSYFETEGTSYISFEMITIWFLNDVRPPQMEVKVAREKARAFIDNLRKRVVKGEISMKQAGEIIASSPELEKIDVAYQNNAYVSFIFVKPTTQVIIDPDLYKAVWRLNEGEVSEILIGKNPAVPKWIESYFAVVKVNKKKMQEFDDVNQLIEKRKKEGLKIVL